MKQEDLPRVPLEDFAAVRELTQPAILIGIRDHTEAKRWKAWDRWTEEALSLRTEDYFSSLEQHYHDEWISFYSQIPDQLQLSLSHPYSILNRTSFSEFVDRCKRGELLYTGGSEHFSLDADVMPHDKMGLNGGKPWVPYYWACSQLCEYLHYDWQGVLLVQVTGEKDVILIDPKYYDHLHVYSTLHKATRYTRIEGFCPGKDPLDVASYPGLKNVTAYYHVHMSPGDALWIPAFWHHTISIPPNVTLSTSIAMKDQENIDIKLDLPLPSKTHTKVNFRGSNPLPCLWEALRILLEGAMPEDNIFDFFAANMMRLRPDNSTQLALGIDCNALDANAALPSDISQVREAFKGYDFNRFKKIYRPVLRTLLRHEVETMISAFTSALGVYSFYDTVLKCKKVLLSTSSASSSKSQPSPSSSKSSSSLSSATAAATGGGGGGERASQPLPPRLHDAL